MVCPRWRTASAINAAHWSFGPSMTSSARLSATRATISARSTFSCPSMRSRTSSLISQCRQSLIRLLHQAVIHTFAATAEKFLSGKRLAERHGDAPGAAALLFDLAHEHLADLRSRSHMSAAARLNVHAKDLNDAHGIADLWRRHHGGSYQTRLCAHFADRPVLHLDRHVPLDDFVDPLGQFGFVERILFEIKIDTRMVGVNGAPGHRRVDETAENVQTGMHLHVAKGPLPVDLHLYRLAFRQTGRRR